MIIKCLMAAVILTISLGVTKVQAKTLEDYIKLLPQHPQIKQILEQSSQLEELAVGELGLPNPQIVIGVDNMPINNPAFDRFLPTSKTLGFEQQIPSYQLRKAKSVKQESLSERQKLIADYTLRRLEAIFISQLSQLDKITKLEKLAHKQLDFYHSMEDDLKGQLEAGKPIYGRFSEIDVERTDLEQRLNDLKAERVSIEQELINLVGEVPKISVPKIKAIKWERDSQILYPVRIAQENVTVADKDIEAANAAFNPDYGIQALYKQREDGSNFQGDDWFSIQAKVSIPLWYKYNQAPKLQAAKSAKRSAKFALDDIKRNWIKRMTSLKAERDIASDNIKLLKEKKSSLKQMVAAAKRNYESGSAPLETVLDAQIDQLTISSQLAVQSSRYVQLAAEFSSHIIGGTSYENN
jgi:cobalt-zinc-cadmium efflux system outer membrane protein